MATNASRRTIAASATARRGGNVIAVGGPGRDGLHGLNGDDFLNTADGVNGNDDADGGGGTNTCQIDPMDAVRNCRV